MHERGELRLHLSNLNIIVRLMLYDLAVDKRESDSPTGFWIMILDIWNFDTLSA